MLTTRVNVNDVWVPLFAKLIWMPDTVCGDCDWQKLGKFKSKLKQKIIQNENESILIYLFIFCFF